MKLRFLIGRISILIIILLLTLARNNFCFSQQSEYSFFIAGHTYGAPGVNNEGLHPPFKDKFDYIKGREEIVMGFLLGDIVPIPSVHDWDEVDSEIAELGLPVYFAVGNHDMKDRVLFESRYGTTYYSFIYNDDLFIVLDPNIDSWNISGEQLLFLKNTLAEYASQCDNVFVLMHQLLWRESNNIYSIIHCNSYEGRATTINFFTEVEPLFTALENNVIFCAGDIGAASWSSDFMYDKYDNITFVATGMGEGDGDNFIVVNVAEDKKVSYDLVCLDTEELFCFGDLEDYEISEKEDDKSEYIEIFPNPTKDIINIKQNFWINYFITVTDQAGRVVYKKDSSTMTSHVETFDFSPGTYIVSLNNGEMMKSQKIIVY